MRDGPDEASARSLGQQEASLVDAVARYLAPVAERNGFLRGHWGQSKSDRIPEGLSLVFEAEPAEFTRRFPGFQGGHEFPPTWPCIDLWIEMDRSNGALTCNLEGDDVCAWIVRTEGPDVLDDGLDVAERVRVIADGLDRILASMAEPESRG